MKKIVGRLCSLILFSILCTNSVWAVSYLANATGKVSNKSTGMGTVYVAPSVHYANEMTLVNNANETVNAENNLPYVLVDENTGEMLAVTNSYDDTDFENPGNSVLLPAEDIMKWSTEGSATVARAFSLLDAGAARPVYAVFAAVANNGYYLKGWSLKDGDTNLGRGLDYNGIPVIAHSVQSQAMSMPVAVSEVYINGGVPSHIYTGEYSGNHYLYVLPRDYADAENPKEFYCPQDEDGNLLYLKFGGSPVFVSYADNVYNRVYIIDDNGKRVDIKESGKYLTPDENGMSYLILSSEGSYFPFRSTLEGETPTYNPDAPLVKVTFKPIKTKVGGRDVSVTAEYENGGQIGLLPAKHTLPQIETMYATFAPVQINGCTGGNRMVISQSQGAVDFKVQISVDYADETADFAKPVLRGANEDGDLVIDGVGTFFIDEYVPSGNPENDDPQYLNDRGMTYDPDTKTLTVWVGFDAELDGESNPIPAIGEYKAYITLASAGKETSVLADLTLIVEGSTDKAAEVTFVNPENPSETITREFDFVDEFGNQTGVANALMTAQLMHGTYKMLNDTYLSGQEAVLPIVQSCTFDLNGKTLRGQEGCVVVFAICNGATLTLIDSKNVGGVVELEHDLQTFLAAVQVGVTDPTLQGGINGMLTSASLPEVTDWTGNLVMENGTIRATNNNYDVVGEQGLGGAIAVMTTAGSTFTMNGGALDAYSVVSNACGVMNAGGTITINGGSLTGNAEYSVATGAWNMIGQMSMTGAVVNAVSDYGTIGVLTGIQPGTEAPEGMDVYSVLDIKKSKITAIGNSEYDDESYGGTCKGCMSIGIWTQDRCSVNISEKTTIRATMAAHVDRTAAVMVDGGSVLNVNGARLYSANSEGNTFEILPTSEAAITGVTVDKVFVGDRKILDYVHAPENMIWNVSAGKDYLEGFKYFYGYADAAKEYSVPVCKIGVNAFATLEDALLYAQNHPDANCIITMLADYTLPAGYYTLPANATLLVPYSDSQNAPMGMHPKKATPVSSSVDPNLGYVTPTKFRSLTLAKGVHLDVLGDIEVSSMQFINGKGAEGNAIPTGPYGWIIAEEGSAVTLNAGSHVYAWGFITGKGEFEARRGAELYEMFQVYDWPGATRAFEMMGVALQSGAGPFLVNQYFMQNIEAPVSYHPGSRMFASFGASADFGGGQFISVAADAIQIVGNELDVAMFKMDDNADADNTWVRKWYDIEHDQQVWEVNSSAHLGSVYIDIPVFKLFGSIIAGILGKEISGFDSRDFVLPITNNMKLHLLTGYMDITQNTEFLPGAELEINKESTVEVINDSNDPSNGYLFFDDWRDWKDEFSCDFDLSVPQVGHQVRYSPSFNGAPNKRQFNTCEQIGSAKMNVHGTFKASGFLFTTPKGADIVSTNEDAGSVVFPNAITYVDRNQDGSVNGTYNFPFAAPTKEVIDMMFGGSSINVLPHFDFDEGDIDYVGVIPGKLRNAAGAKPEFAETSGSAELKYVTDEEGKPTDVPTFMVPGWEPEEGEDYTMPNESFNFVRNRWTKMCVYPELDDEDYEGDFYPGIFSYNNYNEWYIKPGDYVAIATTTKDAEGEFKSARTTTQPLENPDHTYSDANGEGRLFILVINSLYGDPMWWEVTIEDNLYKGKNGTFYYYDEDNGGWREKTFEITFTNWDGEILMDANENPLIYELHYGDKIPYCSSNPTRENTVDYTYTFNGWSPEITADTKVTGDATYTAKYEATLRKYTVIFLNENGTEIERHFLTRDEMPVCEALPSKTGYYLQWTPAIGAVTGDAEYRATFTPEKPTEFMITFKNYDGTELQSGMVNVGETPACAEPTKPATSEYTYAFDGWNPAIEPVSQEMTYTAKFREVANTYAIRFLDEHDVQIGETQNLAYGEQPVAPELTKSNPETGHTYTLVWTPSVATVTGAADYKASFRDEVNKYTVTVNTTGCVVNGAGAYDYGTKVTLSLGAALNGYENPKWADGTTGNKTITVTENVTFVASASIIVSPEVLNINLTAGGEDITLTEDTKVASFNIVAGEGVVTPQLFGAEYIDMLKGAKAYFTYDFGTAEKLNWYAFAVPFKCDAQTATAANGSILRNTHEYDIIEYDGAVRAAQGPVDACWKYVSGILYPGKLYMIIFNRNQTTITFTGKDNLTYYYDHAASVEAHPGHIEGDDQGFGWNGIANPAMYSATLTAGAEYAEEYVDGGYSPVNLSDALAIAKPVFVQATATQPVVVEAPSASSVAARRAQTEGIDRYVLNFGQDRVFLVNDEMAEDEYVAGHDLAKFGVSTKAAQIWVNRYGTQLCVNHQAAEWGETTYPLGVFAPKTDSYTFSINNANNSKQVWMLEDGIPVWNFAYGDYTCDITKGTTLSYSICIRQTPTISTPVENVEATTGTAEKVLINGVLYIVRDKATYNAAGEKIK